METLIEAIRVALLPDATDEAKHQGALACRTILTTLDTKAGEPLAAQADAPAAPAPAASPAFEPQQVAAIVGALRGLPPEQLLDLAIARLRAALPAGAAAPAVAPIRFQILQLGPLAEVVGVKGGGS